MSEPTIARGEPADLQEQALEIVPDDEADEPLEVVWESDPADQIEQSRAVAVDDERDDEHQS